MPSAALDIENIGGIDDLSVDLPPGVTVLTGPNASNKTSVLQALMAALGSDNVSLKGDADTGRVELDIDGNSYERRLKRTETGVTTEGNPYLDDHELADLFAFLLRSNEARRSVEADTDLRELIMRPVDMDAIKREIDQLQEEKRRLDDELDELSSLKERLPKLEQEKNDLDSQIEAQREELADVEAKIESADVSVEEQRDEEDELESKLEELRSVRRDLEDVRRQIETKRSGLDSLREELSDLQDRRDDLSAVPEAELSNIKEHIDDLRSQKQTLDSEISELQNAIQFNERLLDEAREGSHPAISPATDGGNGGSVTEQLLTDDSQATVCWTCGSEVSLDQIEDTVDNLRDLHRQKLDAIDEIEADLDEYKEQQADYERQANNRQQIDRQISRTEREIESTEQTLERLTERKESLTEEMEELESEVEELESATYDEVLEHHRTANDIEYELGTLEGKRDEIAAEIAEIEETIGQESELEQRRETVQEELVDQRTKIDRLEANAVEQFNERMSDVLAVLDYDNIERIWIEIVEKTVQKGRRKVDRNAFELHVVRSSDSGVTYEDTVDHLSESEREVTGLVFALAGYLVHGVHETVPFMLLDSLEAIDSERIAALVEYFESHVDYLVVALLPEDAAALTMEHHQITEFES